MLGDYNIQKSISTAWLKIEPLLRSNPSELAIRLARRRSPILLRPPRAWCLAVRASDARISPLNWAMIPDKPVVWDARKHCRIYREHEVWLEAKQLRRICAPFFIPKPGLDTRDLAKYLGVTMVVLWKAVKRGELSVHYYKGLEGRRGKPVPIVYCNHMIDPAAVPLTAKPDLIWGAAWNYLAHHIPPDLFQKVRRKPVFKPHRGDVCFRGWTWICPSCGQDARRIFYPLPPLILADFVDTSDKHGSPDALQPPNSTFACCRCHNILYYIHANHEGWNQFISHITGGLLYGHEVAKPPGFKYERKRPFRPRPLSKRPDQITAFLINTNLMAREIAARLGLTRSTVNWHINKIYRRNHVHTRLALKAKLLAQRPVIARAAG